MSFLSRDAILSCSDLRKTEVPVPEWGGSVYVRVLSGAEKDKLEGYLKEHPHENVRAFIAAGSICDDSGCLLFSVGDLDALGNKSASALDRVYLAALEINAITEAEVDTLEKKSEPTDSSASNSGKPVGSE